MQLSISKKTALITGASGGIGRAIAYSLASEGARIAIHYNKNEDSAAKLLGQLPGKGHFLVKADLSVKKEIDDLFQQVSKHWQSLDILVNNAGVFLPHPMRTMDDGDWWDIWSQTMDINLNHVAWLIKRFLPLLENVGNSRIINITSRGAFRGEPEHVAYGASKAGLNALSQSLAKELADVPIYVYAVAPGFVKTGMTRELLSGNSGKAIRSQSPLNREAKASEIAHTVCMLCSQNANYMTGAVIDVNGASYLR